MKEIQTNAGRRQLLKHGLAVAVTSLAGCRLGGDSSTPFGATEEPPPAAATEWAPRLPVLISGSGATFDLTTTLPTSVKRGGVFGIDSSGQRLPAGMSLSARGLLAVGTAAIGSVAGVIFTYDAP